MWLKKSIVKAILSIFDCCFLEFYYRMIQHACADEVIDLIIIFPEASGFQAYISKVQAQASKFESKMLLLNWNSQP